MQNHNIETIQKLSQNIEDLFDCIHMTMKDAGMLLTNFMYCVIFCQTKQMFP